MAELIYSLNGKYFKDYDIFISSSDGLLDGLKPKKQDTYDWSEYSGVASDITQIKRFDVRQFTLTGFVKGDDWNIMMAKFWTVFGDLNRPGRQRLLIDPFGIKPLCYDVINEDNIDVKKTFKDGICFATFIIKLIEQKPIKKILYSDISNLQLSFNSPKWVEINIDGSIETLKGVISINKSIPQRTVTKYSFQGRNLLQNSKTLKNLYFWHENQNPVIDHLSDSIVINMFGPNSGIYQTFNANNYTGPMTVSFDAISILNGWNNDIKIGLEGVTTVDNFSINDVAQWTRFKITLNVTNLNNGTFIFYKNGSNNTPLGLKLKNIKLELGNKATDWKAAPEDQHFISIAGESDEITNLTTNAEVLWEKL